MNIILLVRIRLILLALRARYESVFVVMGKHVEQDTLMLALLVGDSFVGELHIIT